MSIYEGDYMHINQIEEGNFPLVIEDPIDPSYNPGHTVRMGRELNVILYEFKKAYFAIAHKCPSILSIPFDQCLEYHYVN